MRRSHLPSVFENALFIRSILPVVIASELFLGT
jgi:hypothetical protein